MASKLRLRSGRAKTAGASAGLRLPALRCTSILAITCVLTLCIYYILYTLFIQIHK